MIRKAEGCGSVRYKVSIIEDTCIVTYVWYSSRPASRRYRHGRPGTSTCSVRTGRSSADRGWRSPSRSSARHTWHGTRSWGPSASCGPPPRASPSPRPATAASSAAWSASCWLRHHLRKQNSPSDICNKAKTRSHRSCLTKLSKSVQ